jgi:hypothetical protein
MSNEPVLTLIIDKQGKQERYVASPELAYGLAKEAMTRMLEGGERPENKRLVQAMKTGIKGLLLMCGDSVLQAIFREGAVPKPQKGDDVLEWYADLLLKVAIGAATKGAILLEEEGEEDHEREDYHVVTRLSTLSFTTSKGDGSGACEPCQGEGDSA